MNVILGAGINALIMSHFTGFKMLGESSPQEDSYFPLGPRLLHRCPEIERLLISLNLSTKIKKVKVGYFYDSELHNNIPDILKKEYHQKIRGTDYFGSSMSNDKQEYEAFIVTPRELYNALYKENRSKIREVLADDIDLVNKKITSNFCLTFSYNKLINTIPAPIFTKISKGKLLKFISKDKHFFLVKNYPLDLKDYDYVYFPNRKENISRITKFEDGHVIIEVVEAENDLDIDSLIDYKELPRAQICNNLNIENTDDVFHIGRFAKWQHNQKIQDVIKDAEDLCNRFGWSFS